MIGMFTAERFKEEDYGFVCEWFKYWKWDPIPLKIIPDDSFIVTNQGFKIAFGCVYISTSGNMCYPEWFVSNPKTPRNLRKGGVDYLINHLCQVGKNKGAPAAFVATKNKNLLGKMINNGFIESDKGVINLIKIL